ncbi:MAG TPA: hypothetical protein VKA38_09955 [Draconibacterium sp.]|nr:hypothetical protein [Draconibacterium sp.]
MKNRFDEFELDKVRNAPDNYIWGIFYFNRRDYRIILPKRNKPLGWTLNFAKIETYLILLILIGGVILASRI